MNDYLKKILSLMFIASIIIAATGKKRKDVFIQPSIIKEKILVVIKKKAPKKKSLLELALKMISESLDYKDSKSQIKKIEDAISLLKKYAKENKKAPGLDCLKKALYNIDIMNFNASNNNLKRAMIQIYDQMNVDKL